MKTALFLLCISLLLTACPTTDTQPANQKRPARTSANSASSDEETEPSKVRPHLGMTKRQIRKLYGDPDDTHVTANGETWFYFFNKGHYWIPYYYGKPRTGTFHFNENGILTDFEYNQED